MENYWWQKRDLGDNHIMRDTKNDDDKSDDMTTDIPLKDDEEDEV